MSDEALPPFVTHQPRNYQSLNDPTPCAEQRILPDSKEDRSHDVERSMIGQPVDLWSRDHSLFTIRPIGQTTVVSSAPDVIRPTAAYGRPVRHQDLGRMANMPGGVETVVTRRDSGSLNLSRLSAWQPPVSSVSGMEQNLAVKESVEKEDNRAWYHGPVVDFAAKETRRREPIKYETNGNSQRRKANYDSDLRWYSTETPFVVHDDLLNTGDIVQCKPALAFISPNERCQWRSDPTNYESHAIGNQTIPSSQPGPVKSGQTESRAYISEPRPETYGRASTPQHVPACSNSATGTRREAAQERDPAAHSSRFTGAGSRNKAITYSARSNGINQQTPEQKCNLPSPSSRCSSSGCVSGSDLPPAGTFNSSSSHPFSHWLKTHSHLVIVTCIKQDYRLDKTAPYCPWSIEHLQDVINDHCRPVLPTLPPSQLHQLSTQLERVLVHVAAVMRLLSWRLPICSSRVVLVAAQMALSPAIAPGCVTACYTAAQLYGGRRLHLARGTRARLTLNVGGFHRWMAANFSRCLVHELASVYLAALIEYVLETLIRSWLSHCRPASHDTDMSPAPHDTHASYLCQLCKPWNFTKSRPASEIEEIMQHKCARDSVQLKQHIEYATRFLFNSLPGHTPSRPVSWSRDAVETLAYFMSCPQSGCSHSPRDGRHTQLTSLDSGFLDSTKRPPLAVWVRVCLLLVDFRKETEVIEDHIVQTAKLLLPTAQCPPPVWRLSDFTSASSSRKACIDSVFGAVFSGSPSVLSSALQFTSDQCGGRPVDTMCASGMTPLMTASLLGHSTLVSLLVSHTAVVNCRTPATNSATYVAVIPECYGWTALTYAVTSGDLNSVRTLLESGADVEAGCTPDTPRFTPLQVAVGLGDEEMVLLLLGHGADPLLSTSVTESPAQPGCYAPVVIAAARGDSQTLLQLLCRAKTKSTQTLSLQEALNDIDGATFSTPSNKKQKEHLCEVDSASIRYRSAASDIFSAACAAVKRLDKSQVRILQEAAYHAAEAGYHDTVVCLSNLDVPWTVHTWLTLLEQVFEAQRRHLVARLLKRFGGKCWLDKEAQLISDRGVPLFFDVLRQRWSDEISRLVAGVISACYNHSSHQQRQASPRTASTTPSSFRTTLTTPTCLTTPTFHSASNSDVATLFLDPPTCKNLATPTSQCSATPTSVSPIVSPAPSHFVAADYFNNAELSDVVFHVQGGQLFGHRLLLVNSSPHFRHLLSDSQQTSPLHIKIDNIRYSVFELLLKHVYISDWCAIYVGKHDLLDLLSAAHIFQMPALFEHIQLKCAATTDFSNIISMYKCALNFGANFLLTKCQCLMLSQLLHLMKTPEFDQFLFCVLPCGHNVIGCLQKQLQHCMKRCDSCAIAV